MDISSIHRGFTPRLLSLSDFSIKETAFLSQTLREIVEASVTDIFASCLIGVLDPK